jgi:hypothetical protein
VLSCVQNHGRSERSVQGTKDMGNITEQKIEAFGDSQSKGSSGERVLLSCCQIPRTPNRCKRDANRSSHGPRGVVCRFAHEAARLRTRRCLTSQCRLHTLFVDGSSIPPIRWHVLTGAILIPPPLICPMAADETPGHSS